MELRLVIISFASILAVIFGQQQCRDKRQCVLFKECWEYRSYHDKPAAIWPPEVQNEVKPLLCDKKKMKNGTTIYKFCCKVMTPPDELNPLDPDELNPLLDLENCGKQINDRVAHGEIAEVFEYPWMVLLGGITGDFHCGGSLIASRFVLTAAHCNRILTTFVRVGETDLSTPRDCKPPFLDDCAEPYEDIPVARFIRHPKYSASKRKNDIALIKLAKPAQLNDNVRPICLPLPGLVPKKLPRNMTVSGWGHTENRTEISNELRYAQLPIIQLDQCQQYIDQLDNVYTVDESQVCAGSGSDLADNCKGDSGGPLQYFGRTGFVIHGVVAWGLASCGTESVPGVYTKVSHYLTWIIDSLRLNQEQ